MFRRVSLSIIGVFHCTNSNGICHKQCVYKVLGLVVQSEYYARHQAVTHRDT